MLSTTRRNSGTATSTQAALPITKPIEIGPSRLRDAVSRIAGDEIPDAVQVSLWPQRERSGRTRLSARTSRKSVDGAAIASEMSVLGRFLVTKKSSDIASFKTPDLRNVLVIALYFHDGSAQTL